MERRMEAGWRGSGRHCSSGDSLSYPSPARAETSTDFSGPLQRHSWPSGGLRRVDVVTFTQKHCTFGDWEELAETRFQVSVGRSPQVPGQTKATSRQVLQRPESRWGPGHPLCPGAQRRATGAAPGLKLWDASVLAGRCEQRGCWGPGPGVGEPPVFS